MAEMHCYSAHVMINFTAEMSVLTVQSICTGTVHEHRIFATLVNNIMLMSHRKSTETRTDIQGTTKLVLPYDDIAFIYSLVFQRIFIRKTAYNRQWRNFESHTV
jgi:hypothetical protein